MSLSVLVVNAIFLLAAFIAAAIMMRSASRFEYYYGMADKQMPLRKRIFRMMFFLIVLSFVAAIFNIVASLFL